MSQNALNPWGVPQKDSTSSIFAIRGDLDGGQAEQDFSDQRQFIGIKINNEEFLLPIEVVNEIIMISTMTYVPGAPQYVEGVINLRGKIIPAINMRRILGHPTIAPTSQSRMIIVNYMDNQAAIIVDGITYVITVHKDQVSEQVLSQNGGGGDLIKEIARQGEKVNGIIDATKVFAEVGGENFMNDDDEEQSEEAA